MRPRIPSSKLLILVLLVFTVFASRPAITVFAGGQTGGGDEGGDEGGDDTEPMRMITVPLGGVVAINGQKFIKVNHNPAKGSQLMAMQRACVGLNPQTTMQGWTGCNALATPTGTNFTQGPILTDTRDCKEYEIRKFADGKCWMVDNLAYGSRLDACAKKIIFSGDGPGDGPDGGVSMSIYPWGYGDCTDPAFGNCEHAGACTFCTSGGHKCGYLYNWQAVIQHDLAYYHSDYQPPEPTQGICPLGWHIPSGGAYGGTGGEFNTLHLAAGSPATGFWQPDGAWKGVFSGWSEYNGPRWEQGDNSSYWSSTQQNSQIAYIWHLDAVYGVSEGIASDMNKHYGYSLRCIKD